MKKYEKSRTVKKKHSLLHKEIGRKVAYFRAVNGMTNSEIADRLNMPLNSYNNLEKGTRSIFLAEAIQLSQIFCISLSEFTSFKLDEANLTVYTKPTTAKPKPTPQPVVQEKDIENIVLKILTKVVTAEYDSFRTKNNMKRKYTKRIVHLTKNTDETNV